MPIQFQIAAPLSARRSNGIFAEKQAGLGTVFASNLPVQDRLRICPTICERHR
jgi:hypothetical protein